MATSTEVSTERFEKLVDHLHERQHISSLQCDDSKSQYDKFLGDVVKVNKESFINFDSNVTDINQFLDTFLGSKSSQVSGLIASLCLLLHMDKLEWSKLQHQ